MTQLLKAPRLRKGDVIGLITPASAPTAPEKIERGVRYLENLGYRVKVGQHVGAQYGYLAGTDAQRIEDLNTMLRDPQVNAIFAIRGGYGTPRLLPMVDYAAVKRSPKILVGYSDLTSLQLALFKRTGLVTFSGPMPGVEFWDRPDPYTEEHFWRMVTSASKIGHLPNPPEVPLVVRRGGKAQGRLLGGNLALMVANLGTRYSPDYKDALLVLEDIHEDLHRIDRMFTQLRNAEILSKMSGLLLGYFTDCKASEPEKPHLTLEQILTEVITWVTQPVAEQFQYGHIPRKLTIPLGLMARFDAKKERVDVLENGVTK